MTDACILIIDDDEDILLSARLFLKKHFKQVLTSKSPKEINHLLGTHEVDLILLDMNYQKGMSDGREGLYWLEHILSFDRDYVVILMTAYGNIELAVQAIKKGATDFILKPWENDKLFATLSAGLKLHQSTQKVKKLEKIHSTLQQDKALQMTPVIGQDAAMQHLYKMLVKVAPTEANVLILGENGTGKQVIAYELHKQSLRKKETFMHVDLGSLHENLFESELFGHVKGAFTDAKEDKTGRFEMADGGTLFLDEIGNLSLPLQAKLLSVLQNREVIRLGDTKIRKIDVRLLCATNMPLDEMVEKGTFRQDLLFRINTVELLLPPLRSRGKDVLQLAHHFIGQFAQKYHKTLQGMTSEATQRLQQYSWPGNVRELQHVIERAVIMSEGTVLELDDFHLSSDKFKNNVTFNPQVPLEEMEKQMVKQAIEKHKGNITKAATELGLTRAALYRRIEKFSL